MFWRANKKSWVTSSIFCDRFWNCFVSEVDIYFKTRRFRLDCTRSSSLTWSYASKYERDILRSTTTTFLQLLDQWIIQAFKICYFRRSFKIQWDNMKRNPDMNVIEFCKKFNITKYIVTNKRIIGRTEISHIEIILEKTAACSDCRKW